MDAWLRSLAWGQAAANSTFVAAAGTSTSAEGKKDQLSSDNVRDVTVSISEIPRHEPLLGTKEHLAILAFSAFLCVLIFFKQSEKRK